MPAHGLRQGDAGQGEFHRHAVAVVAQLGVDSLREAVEGARDEQDVHVCLPAAARCHDGVDPGLIGNP